MNISDRTLNYLLLTGMNHAKIINFGNTSVESRFISSSLTPDERHNITFEDKKWINTDNDSKWLKELIISLVNEWGAFLSVQLFYDAIAFFRNGKENIVKPLEIYCENVFLELKILIY